MSSSPAHLDLSDSAYAGQAIYSRRNLRFYDLVVLTLSNPLVWRCPTRRILALYDAHVSDEHLDVGVGTGWYLDHCRFPGTKPRVGLLDLNPDALSAAAQRIRRYHPEQHRADVLQPIDQAIVPFRSVALTYLLHCLPGNLEEKAARTLDHLTPLLRPEGVVFGATLLGRGVHRSSAARALMGVYNRQGVFCNEADSLEGLHAVFAPRFEQVEVEVVGCVALFVVRRPRTPSPEPR